MPKALRGVKLGIKLGEMLLRLRLVHADVLTFFERRTMNAAVVGCMTTRAGAYGRVDKDCDRTVRGLRIRAHHLGARRRNAAKC